jgi:hypothetical protein
MFQMHRLFCATPWELEAERGRFHDIVGQFNETVAQREGILYIPVTLVNIRDKRPFQYVIDENIRDSRHCLFLFSEGWGPPERNFRNDYHQALQAIDDPASALESVAVLAKKIPSGVSLVQDSSAADLPAADGTFSSLDSFDICVNGLLSRWLKTLLNRNAAATAR